MYLLADFLLLSKNKIPITPIAIIGTVPTKGRPIPDFNTSLVCADTVGWLGVALIVYP